ncbi:GrpB family protein [Peribacillus sp. SI8-4]|uniref:GrpB family protein n=1 Tax=Peribacillus sp. SI8-4 TaxID=3048009 RepID=UPI002552F72F|nr:GrpB family protein [Peribacillus sp. SI8-4]
MEKKITIEDYNPDWVSEFEQEKTRIITVLHGHRLYIEHIGSTSVKGLAAKPVLDLMAGVQHLDEAEAFIQPLRSIGYEFVSHKEFPERRFFRKGQWRAGTHHLHIYEFGSEQWKNQLAFRDYVSAHPEVRKQYQQLKQDLAQVHSNDRARYTKGKAPFIQAVLKEANENRLAFIKKVPRN